MKPELPGLVDDPAEVVAHAAEGLEVLLHQPGGLTGADPQLLGEPERRQSVGEAVVHRLDLGALLGAHVVGVDTEDPCRGDRVEVLPGAERLDEQGVLGQVRHDPHLDLAVVGGHQRLVALADDEPLADPTSGLGADRDVLEVGIGAGEATGRGDDLVVRRVDPAVRRDGLEQALDGLAQPDHVAVAQQVLEERVLGLLEELPGARRRPWCSRSWCAWSWAWRARRRAPPAAAWASRG